MHLAGGEKDNTAWTHSTIDCFDIPRKNDDSDVIRIGIRRIASARLQFSDMGVQLTQISGGMIEQELRREPVVARHVVQVLIEMEERRSERLR